MVGIIVVRFIDTLCLVLSIAIIIRVILSWFSIRPDNPAAVIIYQITEPILAPLRRIIPSIGMIDITPMVAIVILWAVDMLIVSLLA